MLTRRRAETSLSTWIAIGAVVIILLAVTGYISLPNASVSNVQTTGAKGVVVTKPLQLGCVDPVAAANCGAVTVTLNAGSSNNVLETLTATSSGVATSTNSYTSGTQLNVRVSGNSKANQYLPFTVPTAYTTDTNIVATIYAVTLGAWTQVFTGTGGTTFTSSTTQNHGLNGFSGNTVTITVSISETTNNAGIKSSYDVNNLLNLYWLIQIDDGGGAATSTLYATVNGLPNLSKVGNTNYYFVVCPDGLSGSGIGTPYKVVTGSQSAGSFSSICSGSLTLQTIGNQVFGGSAGFSFSIAVGSLTTSVETFQFKMYYYSDPAYFVTNGNLGPSATQSGSTFTIRFTG